MIDLEASPRVLTRRRIGRDKSHVTRQQGDSSAPRAEPAPNHRLKLAVTGGQTALSPEYEQQAESSAVAALLQRIASGDEAAMRALHLRYNWRVFAFVLNRLRDSAEAEEVVADTMFEVWKHPLRFRGESRFSTWLLGIARHKLLNTLRAREPVHDEINASSAQLPGHAPDGFAVLNQKQRLERVLNGMRRLPPEQRECLHLALFESLTLKEIARLQCCPENTVKTRLFHARRKLSQSLGEPLSHQTELESTADTAACA